MIPPSGNTSFDIVFLGREEGVVENTLYIHTSAGSFRFPVRATGMPNPYRLKPLVGVKMPINSSYSPLIEMHNPHSEPIQVLTCCISQWMLTQVRESIIVWLTYSLTGLVFSAANTTVWNRLKAKTKSVKNEVRLTVILSRTRSMSWFVLQLHAESEHLLVFKLTCQVCFFNKA